MSEEGNDIDKKNDGPGEGDKQDNQTDKTGEEKGGEGEKKTGDNEGKAGDESDKKDLGTEKGSDGEKTKSVPEAYDLKLPKGSLLSEEAKKGIEDRAKELGLDNKQAQALLNDNDSALRSYHESLIETREKEIKQWEENIANDKEIGLEKFKENQALAARAIERFATPELKKLLDETGYGSHPEVFRFALAIGRATADDKVVNGQTTNGQRRPTEEVLYSNPQK